MTIAIVLLATMAAAAFVGYRIKTRGLATVFEDVRRFVTIQNSKDMVAYTATKRVVLRLRDKLDEYGENLDERHRQRERERATQPSQPVTARHSPRARRRAQSEHWINRNAGPNTPRWLKDANKAVWDGVLIYGLGSIAIVVLLIVFLIGLNMG